jgi:Xaa-Pro aminopeptidase
MKLFRSISACALLMTFALSTTALSQEKFNREEFARRRAALFEQISDGIAVVYGEEEGPAPVKFRQAPDFYYLTGIEDPGAIAVFNGMTKKTTVFAYPRSPQKIAFAGPGLLETKGAKETYGIDNIAPLDQLTISLMFGGAQAKHLYLPLAEDSLQYARGEMLAMESRYLDHPLYHTQSNIRIANKRISELNPQVPVANLNPILNKMRSVKSPYEIERMRKAGQIGAESVKEAIEGTKPGMYEYQLEAAARFVTFNQNAGVAYTPIVASGPNALAAHYETNNRQMQAGDLVLMDYGSDYDYYVSDITRTWPVSGKFTPEQEKMYACVVEASKTIIAAIKPGVTLRQLKDAAGKVYEKHGFFKEWKTWGGGEYIGHFVGMSVHDVNTAIPGHQDELALQAGNTFNVEPILEIPEKQVHIRLEDSVLVTPNGAENLTKDVPVELDEIYALIKQKGLNP